MSDTMKIDDLYFCADGFCEPSSDAREFNPESDSEALSSCVSNELQMLESYLEIVTEQNRDSTILRYFAEILKFVRKEILESEVANA